MLPQGVFPSRTVKVSGGDVQVRGLSYAEGQSVRGEDAVYIMIATATSNTVDDVKAWCESVPAGDVMALTTAINELSGFAEGAQFQE
jgi:hypothetical protein